MLPLPLSEAPDLVRWRGSAATGETIMSGIARANRPACLLLAAVLGLPAAAQGFELGLPLACEPLQSCWIPRYVDLDPGPGMHDYNCGSFTGPAHSGTDFAIRNLAAMARGVPVLAAAAGTVKAVRDGMDDVNVETIGKAAIADRECGNGVVLDHGEGWETQYCHLRKGSVVVVRGQRVMAGDKLGLVGLSGDTSFPHVHLSVRKDGQQVDPFRGLAGGPDCGAGASPLWAGDLGKRMPYLPVLLINMGFAPEPPDWTAVQNGAFAERSLSLDAAALVLWFEAFGLREGDLVSWRITAPDGGTLFESEKAETKSQARSFRFSGKKRPPAGWQPGTYKGEIIVRRPGSDTVVQLSREVELR